ncbi:MAG: glycoside hydrolase [Cytophagia bacterium]|nr:MAG: glycoside hydrolase [Runella sp.]TAG20323.1 MAG: glycoside hydrolase [Cytophagales bacterium]TAG39479.1 MAG: glycoside hydrolase [Cytophagia bacterium]TAG55456.1 MAG: glycoside hydrolase [Runella slithyformis]TAG61757.1 MAG: glycoside hydrolase [Runella slithyformis]
MARRVSSNSSQKPLPRWIWLVALGICAALGSGLWYWKILNINQWVHVSQLGIRMPLRYTTHGIDVSHHNDNINWDKLRQMRFEDLRLQFVFVKATEGTSLIDTDFGRNWQQADAVGLYRGAYHFYVPWKNPAPQAANFIKTVKLKKGDLPPVLDFEIGTNAFSREQVIKNLKMWLVLVENHYGVRPIIYTNADFYKRYIKDNLDQYPLWIADYSRHTLDRYDSANILFWQHSQTGWVSGVRTPVDYNVFLGSDLAQIAIP